MTDTKTTGERLADQASEWALVLGEVSDGPIITSLYGTDISKQIKDVKDILTRCSEALSTKDEQYTAMAWTLAEIRQIIGVDEKPMLSELPDLVRAAVKGEWLPIDGARKDIEMLLMALYNSDEWDDIEHQEILDRWRANRGDAEKSEWTWWAGEIDGECYSVEASCDKDTRSGIIEMARNEMPDDCEVIEIIQARTWHDEIEGDEIKQFAETRYHEVVDIRVRNHEKIDPTLKVIS